MSRRPLGGAASSTQTASIVAMMGQSNSVAIGQTANLPANLAAPYPSVPWSFDVFNTAPGPLTGGWAALAPRGTTHGAEITMGRALFAAGRQVAIYKTATAAQAIQYFIDNWASTVSLLDAHKNNVPSPPSPAPQKYSTLFWQQGEGDCTATLAPIYQSKLVTLAGLWRAYTGENSRIVIVEIAHNITDPAFVAQGGTTWYPTVAAGQAAFVAGDVNARLLSWSSSWGLLADGIHYDSAAQQAIGIAAAPLIF